MVTNSRKMREISCVGDRGAAAVAAENRGERDARFYPSHGGPLLSNLLDEAKERGESLGDLSLALGVTAGHLMQISYGNCDIKDSSPDFLIASANYLGLPPIVAKVLAGSVSMSDFLVPSESEEVAVKRSIRQIMRDPKVRKSMPVDLLSLSFDAKKAIVLLYQQFNPNVDFFGAASLPNYLQSLQRAGAIREKSKLKADTGCRDIATRKPGKQSGK